MAHPKHRTSKSKRNMRRSHDHVTGPNVVTCPQCGETRLPHHACRNCGTYKGRTVVENKEE